MRRFVEPHGQSPWHRHVPPDGGDILPPRPLLHPLAAHGHPVPSNVEERPWRNGREEPHGQSPWHRHVPPDGGDIPPTRWLLHCRAARGRRPWRNGGIASALLGASVWCLPLTSVAEWFDVEPLLGPWPTQSVRRLEVGRTPVTWRQRAGSNGLFAGVTFTAPLGRQAVWERATAVTDLARISPHIARVVMLEDGLRRQRLQVTLRVLWKRVTLIFDVEKDPPSDVQFRLLTRLIGEYRGACRFEASDDAEAGGPGRTTIACATQLIPSRPVPRRVILLIERMVILRGVQGFLDACERGAN